MNYIKLATVLFLCAGVHAQVAGPSLVVPPSLTVPPSSLGGASALGERFESKLGGISLCPPEKSTAIRASENPEVLGEFVNAERGWDLKVLRVRTPGNAPLVTAKDDKGETHKGIQESVVEQLQQRIPGAEVVRNDQTNIADSAGKTPNVGMIAMRFMDGATPKLIQQAIIQGEESYYLLDFTAPGAKPGTAAEVVNAEEKQAVELFAAVLDSVKLEDSADIKEEQIQRLFRAHAFYYNLTPAAYKKVIVPERWFRIVHEGTDLGYTYIAEELATQGNREGFRVTVRSRTFPAKGKQQDSESQLFCAFDRSHEEWTSSGSLTSEGQAPLNVSEVGISDRVFKSLEKKAPPIIGTFRAPSTQASVDHRAEVYNLSVTFSHASVKPLKRELLPPYYLQQALGHLLPRLLPVDRPQTFLFATYVPEQREVVMRYVDVGKERDVPFFGEKIRAIPISDRLGYDGPATTHYVSANGKYLGSINSASQIGLVPSDQASITAIFAKPGK